MSEHRWDVPLSDLVIDEELSRAVRETVESGSWSTGPRAAEFESAFAVTLDPADVEAAVGPATKAIWSCTTAASPAT